MCGYSLFINVYILSLSYPYPYPILFLSYPYLYPIPILYQIPILCRIGQGQDRDRIEIGIGQGQDRDRIGIGQRQDRDRMGQGHSLSSCCVLKKFSSHNLRSHDVSALHSAKKSAICSSTRCEDAEMLEFIILKMSDYGMGDHPESMLRGRSVFGI